MSEKSEIRLEWEAIAKEFPFHLCLVAEETGSDFERSLNVAQTLGIDHLEFGTLWGQRIDHAPFEMHVKAKQLLSDRSINTRMVATQAFKTVALATVTTEDIYKDPHYRDHLNLLEVSIEAARYFEAPLVRIFSFRREGMADVGNPSPRFPGGGALPDEIMEKIVAALKPAVEMAARAGVTLALENVRSCWGNTGNNAARILQAVDSPWLKAIWDPANSYVSGVEDLVGEDYPAVRGSIAHVHLKDAVVVEPIRGLTEWERIGDGAVGLSQAIRILCDDNFTDCVSIETHWRPDGSDREDNTRETYAGLMNLLEKIAADKLK